MSSTCPNNMANFSPLTAEICWRVWGTPANFNGFRVLPSLLQPRRSPEANQTLHGVWPCTGLPHYIYIFGGFCPLTEFCPVQNSLYVQVLGSPNFARSLAIFWAGTLYIHFRGLLPPGGILPRTKLTLRPSCAF